MGQITLQEVRKSFGPVNIIRDANLDIEDGSFVVFVGPSGCGKTTLLRLIAGLEDVTGGQILIDGRNVVNVPPAKRGLSMVFQSYALYPHMSVRGNIAFGLKMAGLPRPEIDRKVEAAAATLNLTPYLDRKPRELSGGQRQRVAIGRAIEREPKAFLFDEPLSNLDAALRVQMRLEVTKLQKQLGTTAVYVTHDQVEAMTMADKIVVLNAGGIEQYGSPLELYERPANTECGCRRIRPACTASTKWEGRFGREQRRPKLSGQPDFFPRRRRLGRYAVILSMIDRKRGTKTRCIWRNLDLAAASPSSRVPGRGSG